MLLLAGHLLMALGAYLLYRQFGWLPAVGFWCLVEGAAVFVVATMQHQQDERSRADWRERS